MRKPPAHFKPEIKPSTTKKKNVMTATLCVVLALVLIMAVAVTGCNSTSTPESEASSQAATASPTAEPTEEPTPTPKPEPTKAFSNGEFQVSCVDFVPLYEDYLHESNSENQNLVMKRVDNSETVTFQMYKGEIDAGITMAFTLDGEPAEYSAPNRPAKRRK